MKNMKNDIILATIAGCTGAVISGVATGIINHIRKNRMADSYENYIEILEAERDNSDYNCVCYEKELESQSNKISNLKKMLKESANLLLVQENNLDDCRNTIARLKGSLDESKNTIIRLESEFGKNKNETTEKTEETKKPVGRKKKVEPVETKEPTVEANE